MKGITMSQNEWSDKNVKQDLSVPEVKETMANHLISNGKMVNFTAAQMWNHRRRSRSASSMLNQWNLN